MPLTPLRLTIVATHPTQYLTPWFRYLEAHQRDLAVTVLYASRPNPEQQGVGFERSFEWDTPLLDGYNFRMVRDAMPEADFHSASFRGLDVPEIGQALLATEPDVVLVPGWHSITLLRAIRTCRRRGIPLVYRGDTHLKLSPQGWRRMAWRAKTRAMLRLYSAHLAVGHLSREYLLAHGVAPTSIYASPHAVDNELFAATAAPFLDDAARTTARAAHGCGARDFVVLFAGKLSRGKRAIDVVHAVARLGPDAVLLIAGAGEQEPTLRTEGQRLGVRTTWLGFVNQNDMGRVYACADCLVLPSQIDSWGLVVNEAMATGLPAIVGDRVGCAPDLVSPGETGEVFPTGGVDELTRALERVRQRGGRARMAAMCRERVARYSFERTSIGLTAGCHAVARAKRAASVRVIACCGGMVVVSGLERMTFEVLRLAREHGGAVHCIVNSWENHRIVPLAEEMGASWSTGLYYYEFDRHTLDPRRHAQAVWEIFRTSAGLLRDSLRFKPTHVLVPDHGTVLRNALALAVLRLFGVDVVFRVANAPERGRFYDWLWGHLLSRLVTHFVANSRFSRTRLLEAAVPVQKITLIHNAVSRRGEAENADADVVDLARSRRTLLVVGQIASFKGTHLAVDAALRLIRDEHDVQMLIVGALPMWPADLVAYTSGLQDRIRAAGASERIRFAGGRRNVLGIMRASYLLAAPILQEETFGNVVLEAKSVGLPSVVFPQGGLVELVTHRETGFVCRDTSIEALMDGVTYFLADPDARARASRRAIECTADPADEYAFARFAQRWRAVFALRSPGDSADRDVAAVKESAA